MAHKERTTTANSAAATITTRSEIRQKLKLKYLSSTLLILRNQPCSNKVFREQSKTFTFTLFTSLALRKWMFFFSSRAKIRAINSSSFQGISYANQAPPLFMWRNTSWATRKHLQSCIQLGYKGIVCLYIFSLMLFNKKIHAAE